MSDCLDKCSRELNDALDIETNRHKAKLLACGSDPACIDAEYQNHINIVFALHEKYKACRAACG